MSLKRRLLSRLLEVASLILPRKAHVAIHGFPADEGNVVEVVAGLHGRYKGRIFWLVDEENAWQKHPTLTNVTILRKYSAQGLFRYITAEAVFFTHGLFGDTRPMRGRTFVNLWHGDGFKVKKEAERAKRSIYPAQYTIGCTSLLTARRAQDFRMPDFSILHVGNPRMDQFYSPLSSESRNKLGLDRGKPYIVWVPTFRSNHGAGVTKGWCDVGEGAPNPNDLMADVSIRLQRAGYTLIVKPHPQDRDSREVPNTVVLDNKDLGAAGTTFYELLGSASAIITDYSSVWTEYLALDRPIGFVVPDREQYLRTRGMYPPDLFEWLPGQQLEDGESVAEFVQCLTEDTSSAQIARQTAGSHLGLSHGAGRTTDNLLDALDANRVFRKSGGLMKPAVRLVSSHAIIKRIVDPL